MAKKRWLLSLVMGCSCVIAGPIAADALERFPIVVPDGCHAAMRRTSVYKTEYLSKPLKAADP